ncbi:MAG: A24 family peptidase [Chloroflexi bacterium]|nr:A24 family peptidase [Chloroflexota bacterium]
MPPRTGAAPATMEVQRSVNPAIIAIGGVFALGGAMAERLASVWPADEAQGRPIGWRTAAIALVSGLAAAGIVARSQLPWWATGVYLVLLALLLVLTATDLEQRRLPHLALDPLILVAVLFVPANPAVHPLDALIGAGAAVVFLGALGLVVRGGLALGDLYLVAPIGLMLGWPAIFSALFAAAFLSAGASLVLLAARRVGMRSYIPFGPFLVAGAVLVLLLDDRVLRVLR